MIGEASNIHIEHKVLWTLTLVTNLKYCTKMGEMGLYSRFQIRKNIVLA
jgi:hypothetical protein